LESDEDQDELLPGLVLGDLESDEDQDDLELGESQVLV
jgi:hypothetical protein